MRERAAALAPKIRRALLGAYDGGKRELPWRGETDPYRIWVSEVMLQQTRVETVIPYYEAWLERFPTLEALAEAQEEDVLRAWKGLGYYSRARNLQKGAVVVRERFSGNVPQDPAELRSLPGVGEYTAGALLSIAFGEAAPAVDGNARRVLSRVFDLPNPTARELRDLAGTLVDPDRPGDFNQALMELGALVCTPRSPDCDGCPINDFCAAFANGTVANRPAKKPKKPVPEVEVAVLVAVRGGGEAGAPEEGPDCRSGGASRDGAHAGIRLFLRRRPPKGLLAGMWEFPGVEVEDGREARAAVRALAEKLEMEHPPESELLRPVPHVFSHLKATYRPVLVHVMDAQDGTDDPSGWFFGQEAEELPLPVAQGKILRQAMRTLQEKRDDGS